MSRALYFISVLISWVILPFMLHGQVSYKQNSDALLLHITYGFHIPAADMADRFGSNFSIGANLEYKTDKGIILGGEYTYIFGRKIKEEIFNNLYNELGEIVATDHHLATITLSERGFTTIGYLGKLLFPFANRQESLKLTLGAGVIQHRVRILDDYGTVTQITGEYQKGYDRMTNGLLTQQYIGYQYLSNAKRINFSIGLVFQQGFTKQIRKYNINSGYADTSRRLDLLNGVKVTWILPFYINDKGEELIY